MQLLPNASLVCCSKLLVIEKLLVDFYLFSLILESHVNLHILLCHFVFNF